MENIKMTSTTIRITDEEKQRIKDLKYLKDITLHRIMLTGLEKLEAEHNISTIKIS